MKIAGGCLIALAVLVTLMILNELAVASLHHPVSFGAYIGAFLSYWWPSPVAFTIGILLWRYKPRNKNY